MAGIGFTITANSDQAVQALANVSAAANQTNQALGGLDGRAKSTASAVDNVGKAANRSAGGVKGLSAGLSGASSALTAFGNQLPQAGQAALTFGSALNAIAASGGPISIAIAATGLLVGVALKLREVYSDADYIESMKSEWEALSKINDALNEQILLLEAVKQAKTKEELLTERDVSASKAQLTTLERQIELSEKANKLIEEQRRLSLNDALGQRVVGSQLQSTQEAAGMLGVSLLSEDELQKARSRRLELIRKIYQLENTEAVKQQRLTIEEERKSYDKSLEELRKHLSDSAKINEEYAIKIRDILNDSSRELANVSRSDREAAIANENAKFDKILEQYGINADNVADIEHARRLKIAAINAEWDKKELEAANKQALDLAELAQREARDAEERRLKAFQQTQEEIKKTEEILLDSELKLANIGRTRQEQELAETEAYFAKLEKEYADNAEALINISLAKSIKLEEIDARYSPRTRVRQGIVGGRVDLAGKNALELENANLAMLREQKQLEAQIAELQRLQAQYSGDSAVSARIKEETENLRVQLEIKKEISGIDTSMMSEAQVALQSELIPTLRNTAMQIQNTLGDAIYDGLTGRLDNAREAFTNLFNDIAREYFKKGLNALLDPQGGGANTGGGAGGIFGALSSVAGMFGGKTPAPATDAATAATAATAAAPVRSMEVTNVVVTPEFEKQYVQQAAKNPRATINVIRTAEANRKKARRTS